LNSYVWKWFKSHAQVVFAQREETKLIATLCEGIMRIRITQVETPNYKR
jgi:hypothetical protein